MEQKPYRPPMHRRSNPFSHQPKDQSSSKLDVFDADNFPSISKSSNIPVVSNGIKWGGVKKQVVHESLASKGKPSVDVNKGWLYIDSFDRVNGKPLIVYGGETLAYSKIKAQNEINHFSDEYKRHQSYSNFDNSVNEAVGDSRSLLLELAENQRAKWLVDDYIDDYYDSSEEEESLQVDEEYID